MHLPLAVAITGASGAIYGVELLKALKDLGRPAHLIISHAGQRTLELETDLRLADVQALAARVHEVDDLAAPLSSGSFQTAGLAVTPCSIKTLSALAHSYNHNLITRAADVCLKERRRLVLVVRETPLHQGHLELMARAASLGAVILPPMPAFYHRPATVLDIVHQTVGKVLDQFGVEHGLFARWAGAGQEPA
ncbi:MAG: UbiX family flavin prenyltransferase [Desulfarculus sp.]|nr:UbiX family flavin prenyltransferase [Desulfarculus sp.]